jgi:hypothetical protein
MLQITKVDVHNKIFNPKLKWNPLKKTSDLPIYSKPIYLITYIPTSYLSTYVPT